MRGDSRLDFVAKSVALAGLGVLGLWAALLDRWGTALPPVSSPVIGAMAPGVQVAVTLPVLDEQMFDPPAAALRGPRSPRLASRAVAAAGIGAPITDMPASNTSPATQGELAAPRPLPMPVESAPMRAVLVALPPAPAVVDTWQPMPAALAPSLSSDDDGFVSGVLKRTGSSVSTSLGKASSSVRGAARAVGGAMKRALPF